MGDLAAGVDGLVWSVGRVFATEGYIRAAEKRSLGFLLSGGLLIGVRVGSIITFGSRHVF